MGTGPGTGGTVGTQLETGSGSEASSAAGSGGGVSIEASGLQGAYVFEVKASVVTRCRPRAFVCALFNRWIQRERFLVFSSLFVFRVVHVIERIIYDAKWRVLSHRPTGQGRQLKHLQQSPACTPL